MTLYHVERRSRVAPQWKALGSYRTYGAAADLLLHCQTSAPKSNARLSAEFRIVYDNDAVWIADLCRNGAIDNAQGENREAFIRASYAQALEALS